MKKIKIQSILTAVAGLLLATSCSSSFLDTESADAVSSDQVAETRNVSSTELGITCSSTEQLMPILAIGHFNVRMI